MNVFVSELVSSVLQLCVFALVPLLWWYVTARKEQSFWAWIGLKRVKTDRPWRLVAMMVGTMVLFGAVGMVVLQTVSGDGTATTAFRGMGLAALPAVLVYAVVHTSLSEELLFRGFLLKRMSARWGFRTGNAVQALLFGLVHGLGLFQSAGPLLAVVITLFTAAIALAMGYVNEKQARGSILPSWLIHAAANILAGVVAAF